MKTLKGGDALTFTNAKDMSYLCLLLAAKSLSACATKQGFVVGFERSALRFGVKHPKLLGTGTNFLSSRKIKQYSYPLKWLDISDDSICILRLPPQQYNQGGCY